MLISISGTHCNGKSALFSEIEDDFSQNSNFIFKGGPTRKLKESGLPINQSESENYDQTQLSCLDHDLEIISEYIRQSRVNKKVVFITERGLLDTYVYSKYLFLKGKLSQLVFSIISNSYFTLSEKYDSVFLPTHFDLKYEKDGVRDGDIEFREDIYELFKGLYTNTKFHWITGNMNSRVSSSKTTLQYLLKAKPREIPKGKSREYYSTNYPESNLIKEKENNLKNQIFQDVKAQ